jgi:DNA-binding GntR family transcriptional regulator
MDLRVSPVTVLVQTADRLREAILTGHFKPGHRLVENDLCRQLGVSRTSVREALRRLEAEKLVTIVPNKGPSVAAITWEEAEQIYDVRALLEGEAAALFAARVSDVEAARMKSALDAFDRAVVQDDAAGRLESTRQFYQVMLAGCGNIVIREMLEGLFARINFLRARSMSRPGRGQQSAVEMGRMLAAVVQRDSVAARQAAVEHVRAACAAGRNVFESQKAA